MSDETTQTEINPNEAINYTTLSEKLNALNNSRLAIISALNENGAEVSTETKLSDIPSYISSTSGAIPSLSTLTYISQGANSASGSFTADKPGVLYCKYNAYGFYGEPSYGSAVFNVTITPSNSDTAITALNYPQKAAGSDSNMASFNKNDVISWQIVSDFSSDDYFDVHVEHEICYSYAL